jgi:pimeloyl-ACP methyl ester carboxylesterase
VDLGAEIHYVEFRPGDGAPVEPAAGRPTVVLVHGIAGSHLNWMRLGPPLARHGRVVAPDLPGHGLSHPLPGGFSVEGCQLALDRFLDAVAGPPVVLVGHSMGGLISLLQTGRHPEKVARLILMSPASPYPWSELASLRSLAFLTAWAAPGTTSRYWRRRSRRVDDADLVRSILGFCYARGTAPDDEVLAAHTELQRRRRAGMAWVDSAIAETAASLTATMLRRREYRRLAAGIRTPTLLLHGTADRVVPFEASLKLSRQRPDWPFHVLPGIGHMVQLEAPESCRRIVETWLAEVAGR